MSKINLTDCSVKFTCSDCEQKESAKAAFDCKLAEELYKKTCKICDIDADKISQSITSDEIAAEFIHVQ